MPLDSALALLQQRGISLPQYCCGCGIKLQQADAQGPGFFIIPARLLQAPAPERDVDAGLALDDDEDPALLEYRRAAGVEDSTAADGFAGFAEEGGEGRGEAGLPDILCQRCYSLRHAGKVKVQEAEQDLPGFDLARKVGRKIALQKDRRAVVLACVDATDFDGSLPRAAIASLYPPGYVDPRAGAGAGAAQAWGYGQGSDGEMREDNTGVKFKLMVALNKVDLLPKEATAGRLVQWVRARMQQAGLPRPDKVFCVSAVKGTGVKTLLEGAREGMGYRGDLWVVGAQNAGKSSLIAAMKRLGGTAGQKDPTVAPLPGTTLGLINVPGVPLGAKNRVFDTPGVPHSHQVTALLAPDDVKLVLPSKPLTPRTYRVPMGSSLLMGGLARLDVVDHPGGTLYLTVWCSTRVNLHMGQVETVEERLLKHVGGQLSPPSSLEAFQALPAWEPRDVAVQGTAWDHSTVDVHIAGLGWVAVGVTGRAMLRVWTFPSVAVTVHDALIPDYAREFCRPGFTVLLPRTDKTKA